MDRRNGPSALSVTQHLRSPRSATTLEGVPTVLLTQSVRRLRIVVLVIVAMTLVGWVGINTLERGFLDEFTRPGDWIPPVTGLVLSLAVYLTTRSSRIPVLTILKIGLAYQVLVSFGIAIGQYWNTFHDLSGSRLTPDLVGVSPVALWMACFTVLVPSKPRDAFVALTLSGAAVPLTVAALIRIGDAPEIPTQSFFTIFVVPYAITVSICLVCARVIYGLGREASAAQRLGSYELESLLGSGGMGTVWRARHDRLARPAAIKLIRPDSLSADPVSQQSVIERFEREAQITGTLESPHTVALYDFGVSDDGELFCVMELLKGIDLGQFVQRFGPLPDSRTAYLLRQVCESLAEAHHHGLIHRDIKPANLMLCESALSYDFVKVLDFGLARQSSRADGADSIHDRRDAQFVGTPSYVAPEAIAGTSNIDHRADLYSLGCVGFWLLTGRPPFDESSPAATLSAHLTKAPPALEEQGHGPVAAELAAVIHRCLAKSPDERPQSALELRHILEGIEFQSEWTENDARDWWQARRAH
jgi:serine/threonine-protein kinase